jgi:uncharacterized RDD family membrane protein YckC
MKTTDGVYFLPEDYASFWLRLFIDVMDALAIGAAWFLVAIVLWTIFPFNRMTLNLTLAIFAIVAFCYLVILKRSKIGTVGYRIGGVRIVGMDGQAASLSALTFRMLFAPFGPLNWFLDLAWLSGDKHRQALRDKLAHTYVVKVKAAPVGTGKIIFRYYEILGFNFLFQEIDVPTTTKADALPGKTN